MTVISGSYLEKRRDRKRYMSTIPKNILQSSSGKLSLFCAKPSLFLLNQLSLNS
jgi:hypothetical protein